MKKPGFLALLMAMQLFVGTVAAEPEYVLIAEDGDNLPDSEETFQSSPSTI